jgi:hypothetical protein
MSGDVKPRSDYKTFHDQLEVLRDPSWFPFFSQLQDFFRWQRGEDVIVKTVSSTPAANTANQIVGTLSPQAGEEWDLIAAWVLDSAAKDPADTVVFFITDADEDSSFGAFPLSSNGGAINTGEQFVYSSLTQNMWKWPNTLSDRGMSQPAEGSHFTLRKVNLQSRALIAQISTTATVGARTTTLYAWVRHRVV